MPMQTKTVKHFFFIDAGPPAPVMSRPQRSHVPGVKAARRDMRQAARVGLVALALPPLVIALYLIKSALGINLLPGPSPLHFLYLLLL